MKGKRIVLGVTGSIAAYKAADLTSLLVKAGAEVKVVMTDAGSRIIAPITLQTLSRNPVSVDLWAEENGWQPGHIELADWAEVLAVVPATANTISCFAHGLAPNLLCNIYLATQAKILIAPAMNSKMLAHPATQANLKILESRGDTVMDTAEGLLACGYEGKGKMVPVESVFERMEELLK